MLDAWWSMVVNYDGRQFKEYFGYDTVFAISYF